MKKLLIASNNPGKFREYKELLRSLPLEIVSLKDIEVEEKVNEDGRTFEENAIKKAKFYSKLTGLATLADDGGLEIDILNGEPGVKSRRWPGYEASDAELRGLVLKKLNGVPWEKRKARLKVVVALSVPDKGIYTAEGKIRGIILTKSRGKLIPGYPFRSIFYLPRYGKALNEFDLKDATIVGHRRKPIKKLIPILKSKTFRLI